MPVIWPRVGQILFDLEAGESIDVSLETDLVPFRAVRVPPKARHALGLRKDGMPITRRADAILQADPHGWSKMVSDFLRSQPELCLRFSRADGDAAGWWCVEAC